LKNVEISLLKLFESLPQIFDTPSSYTTPWNIFRSISGVGHRLSTFTSVL